MLHSLYIHEWFTSNLVLNALWTCVSGQIHVIHLTCSIDLKILIMDLDHILMKNFKILGVYFIKVFGNLGVSSPTFHNLSQTIDLPSSDSNRKVLQLNISFNFSTLKRGVYIYISTLRFYWTFLSESCREKFSFNISINNLFNKTFLSTFKRWKGGYISFSLL